MLVVIAVLFSLVVALVAAILFYAANKDPLGALATGGAAFAATMTIVLCVFAFVLQ